MDFLAALWHLLNFFASSVGMGFFASLMVRVFWRRETRGTAWWRLWAWSACASALAAAGGLIVFGRDGKMATYFAMVLACAASLWWLGLRPGRQ